MTLLYPLGLLGLIAVPLLILIYILKNKHTEQVISSTYLWTLSERFLKKKNPISRLTGIISLILQILAVVCISFAIAHPVFTLPGAADDYVFILDGSGSMHYVQEDATRFELGKAEIKQKIEASANGSSYTLITVGESTGVLFENVEDKSQALSLLEEAELSATASGFADARGLAQEYFANNPAARIFLVTDKSFETLENAELINISSKEENYAVANLKQEYNGATLVVTGEAYSYESDVDLTVSIEVVGGGEPVTDTITVSAKKLEAAPFAFSVAAGSGFRSVKVTVENADALSLDNESCLYNVSGDAQKSVLIVSEDPFFIQMALTSLIGKDSVATMTKEEYDGSVSGYQLYVFESFSPELLPKDGAVWFINPQNSVASSGFSVQGEEPLEQPATLSYSTSTATRIEELMKEVDDKVKISIKEYVRCSFYRNFHTVLSYDGSPLLFAGTNSYDNRQVVFAFDFHKSDFIMTYNYLPLIRNLLGFTFPAIVSETSYFAGESVAVNVLANCKSIRVDTPSGDIAYLDTGSDLVEYTLTEVGEYKITQMVDDQPHIVYVYGNLPMEERASTVSDSEFVVTGEPSKERRDGKYEDLIILLIILAAIFLADWGVYCYEQYQLR